MNNFFTDEAWNLYDWNQNLVAKYWEYQVDEQWNISILEQNKINNSTNNWINETKKNSLNKELNLDFLKKIFWWKKEEQHHEKWIQEKINSIDFNEKFPSEYTFLEDIKSFLLRVQNLKNIFQSDKQFAKNAARWKLFLISKKEIVWFLDQLSVLLNSWIRLVDAVLILKKQAKNQSLKILLWSVAEKMWNWMHLSESFENYNYIFPKKWIEMIKAAEKSWKMSEILTDLAKEEIDQMEFISKIKWAMTYPWILITMALWVFWLMMTKMVPSLEKSFWSVENFPALTQNVIAASHYMQENFWTIFVYIIIFFLSIIFLNSQFVTVKKFLSEISLRLPIFWWISKMKNIVIFADNLSLMVSSWVVVSESLKITAQTMSSILYQKEVHKIRRWINDWKTISQMMWLSWKMDDEDVKENFYFPLEIAQMIKIWEETWNTIWVLKKISETNTNKLNNIVKNLTSLLEPIITLIIWWMVWTLIIAFMLPMMSSFKNVS